jgi:hypothetical protein
MYRSPYRFTQEPYSHKIVPTVQSVVEPIFCVSDDERVTIPYKVRNQHIYIPGKTRHGKSTLIHAMAYQDIMNGAGVCVIDPKGDLVNSLIHWVPEGRKDDCIYLSPKAPVPINFLDYCDEDEKETLVGELKYVITRGTDVRDAPLMNAILTDLIYTLLNANENPDMPTSERATFLDVYRFLVDPDRMRFILSFVKDASLKHRWENNFPHPKDRDSTLTRMTPFIRNASLSKLFDDPTPKLNIAELMDTRKILLVDLGGISESTKILGTLLIAKIRQAAFRRADPKAPRTPFHLYVDEFEFFQTSDFDQILSFAGGYGLRLTLANQFIGQLDSNIRQSIFGNVGSFIVFCVSMDDSKYFKHMTDHPVWHLRPHQAMYKIAGQWAVVKETPKPPPAPTRSYADDIRKRTLELYSCKSPRVPDNAGDAEKPEPEPTLPNHALEAPGAPVHERVLRPSNKRPGRFTKKS